MRNRMSPTSSMAQRVRQRGTFRVPRLTLEALSRVGMSSALAVRSFIIPPSTRCKDCTTTNLSQTPSFPRIILQSSQRRTRGTWTNVKVPLNWSTARVVAQRAMGQAKRTTKMMRERRKSRKNPMRRTEKMGKMNSSSPAHSRRRVR